MLIKSKIKEKVTLSTLKNGECFRIDSRDIWMKCWWVLNKEAGKVPIVCLSSGEIGHIDEKCQVVIVNIKAEEV